MVHYFPFRKVSLIPTIFLLLCFKISWSFHTNPFNVCFLYSFFSQAAIFYTALVSYTKAMWPIYPRFQIVSPVVLLQQAWLWKKGLHYFDELRVWQCSWSRLCHWLRYLSGFRFVLTGPRKLLRYHVRIFSLSWGVGKVVNGGTSFPKILNGQARRQWTPNPAEPWEMAL